MAGYIVTKGAEGSHAARIPAGIADRLAAGEDWRRMPGVPMPIEYPGPFASLGLLAPPDTILVYADRSALAIHSTGNGDVAYRSLASLEAAYRIEVATPDGACVACGTTGCSCAACGRLVRPGVLSYLGRPVTATARFPPPICPIGEERTWHEHRRSLRCLLLWLRVAIPMGRERHEVDRVFCVLDEPWKWNSEYDRMLAEAADITPVSP
jgi:hypothetical protein